MKQFKTSLYLFLSIFTVLLFFSCSSDPQLSSDDGKIIGYWPDSFESVLNVDGSFNENIRPCSGVYLRIREDGTMNMQIFREVAPQQCTTIDSGWLHEGRWERLATEKYRFILTSSEGERDSIIEPEYVRFPNDGLMKIQFEPIVYNGIDTPFYYELTFFRED